MMQRSREKIAKSVNQGLCVGSPSCAGLKYAGASQCRQSPTLFQPRQSNAVRTPQTARSPRLRCVQRRLLMLICSSKKAETKARKPLKITALTPLIARVSVSRLVRCGAIVAEPPRRLPNRTRRSVLPLRLTPLPFLAIHTNTDGFRKG